MRIIYPGISTIKGLGGSHSDTGLSTSTSDAYLTEGIKDPANLPDTEVVALDVLDKFGIPTSIPAGSPFPSRGQVKGFDIRSMAAPEAIRLSLAETMLDAELWEVYGNNLGEAQFIHVGGQSWTPPAGPGSLISRTKTKLLDQDIELVVVRGYDRPPRRVVHEDRTITLLDSSNGRSVMIVQPIRTGEEDDPDWSSGYGSWGGVDKFNSVLNKHASIIYQEPAWDAGYKSGLERAYHPRCFESLIAWKMVLNWAATDLDKDAQVEFSNTSTIPVKIGSNQFISTPEWADISYGFQGSATVPTVGGVSSLNNFMFRENHYGETINTFQGVSNLFIYGKRVRSFTQTIDLINWDFYDDQEALFELSEGTDFTWRLNGIDDDVVIDIIYNLSRPITDVWLDGSPPTAPYMPVGGGLGYFLRSFWANLTVNLPSINIYSPDGQALQIANAMVPDFVKAIPVVIQDVPPPVYYKFKPGLGTAAGLQDSGFIDQSQDIVDSDPNTEQPLDSTPSKLLQDSGVSRTVDVSLPFVRDGKVVVSDVTSDGYTHCSASEVNNHYSGGEIGETDITTVRDFIYDLYNEEGEVTTQTQLIYGGSVLADGQDLPFLGMSISDETGDLGVINSISYSMQDASSFQLSITAGRKIVNVGSWGTEIYQRRTETVSRTGTVIRAAGNGSLFAVKVDGMGVYSAISSIREEVEAGDRVNVTIYNNPVEV